MTLKHNKTTAIIFMVMASLCFALMSLCTSLVTSAASIEKAFFRNFFSLLISLSIILKRRTSFKLVKGTEKLMVARALGGTTGVICNFYALDHTLFANANMLNKLSPFAAIAFSVLLYKEKVKPTQIACVVLAFAGSLFILKPGGDMFGFASLVGLIGGIGAGFSQACLRGLKVRGNDTMLVVFYFSCISVLITLPFAIPVFTSLGLRDLSLLFLTAAFAAGGQFALTNAYSISPAREVSIYDYSQMIFAGLFGYIFFRQIPDILSFVGYIVIFSAAYIMYRYSQKHD